MTKLLPARQAAVPKTARTALVSDHHAVAQGIYIDGYSDNLSSVLVRHPSSGPSVLPT